jgi:hypothetical protein
MQPTYFVKHPDETFSEATPQPVLLGAVPKITEALKFDGTFECQQEIKRRFPALETVCLHPHNTEEQIVSGGEWGWTIEKGVVKVGSWIVQDADGSFTIENPLK